ncbi:hypothetical protein WA026_004627 [Henosepilachna vigintioctopunctata]|uniref:Rho GTPase-activating protein 7 n=1 Tax=Henosepilachna vigintioctopunctata TaxID=420089 RepID=A0AAW1V265_9CUCU
MNLNDQYEELALYLLQAENEISQVFENNVNKELATVRRANVPELTSNQITNGAYPKTDHNGHKVHFAESKEQRTVEPDLISKNGCYFSGHTQNGDSGSKNGDYDLKSCLKSSGDLNRCEMLSYPCKNLNANRGFSNGRCDFKNESNQNSNRIYTTPYLFVDGNDVQYPLNIPMNTSRNSIQNIHLQTLSGQKNVYQVPKQHSLSHDAFQDDDGISSSVDRNDADENILSLIESIKEDIRELKEKYEHDDEIERNRYLTKELDEILNLYKMNITMSKETDILSDVTSTSSYHSVSLETVVQNADTPTSPQLTSSSTNLSKVSECSSSPCLTSVSDNELADDDHSISSSECRYHTPSEWEVSPTPQAVLRGKSSSAPVLKNQQPKVNKQARSQSDRHLAEIEAAEACKWLRATGFPQYAQMYEEMQFPVDISTAAKDHPRLDPDVLSSLYRRLQILNNCVHLHQQKNVHNTDESEDENYALSKNWTFQSDIRRWSRACIDLNPESEASKCTKKVQESDEVFEDCNSPRERFRRGGSVKYNRRREGVIISDSGAKLLDSLSEQLTGISVASSQNNSSDAERTPKFYDRLWGKAAEKDIQNNSPENSVTFQVSSIKDDEANIFYCKFSSQQLGQLERIAMLKLTAYIEKYCPTHRTGWNWDVPKNLIRKMKNPAYKVGTYKIAAPIVPDMVVAFYIDKSVFGVPIQLTLQRTGHPLPRNIENALEWLQQNATEQVGLFRKSGVKSRIQSLRSTVESSTDMLSFEDHQSYDVADMVKQYFRELPEALLTNKLSETFKLIFQYVPNEYRLDAVLCGVFLMPDEHIEVLQTLIDFLISIAKHSNENQMNESNLATCFAPSLFYYPQLSKSNFGAPHPKDLAENKAAHDCLLFFLENHQKLFTIPRGLINQCNPAEMREWKVLNLEELGKDVGGWKEYLQECEQAYLKEIRDKSRGWTLLPNCNATKVEVFFKKLDDGLSVRVWKAIADIDAPPSEVLHRIMRERHIWDLELMSAKIVLQLNKDTEIFQYGRRRMSSLPLEEYCVVRHWRSDYPRGACMIVETSVEHEDIVHIPGSIKGIVHASRYYIEPCGSGRSRIHHMCRTDTMGRKPEYYYKNYGHIIGIFISNIQNSFYQQTSGPESKV